MTKSVDWTALEKLLADEATRLLRDFATNHRAHEFYGAIFDVEPYDGCFVHLRLNTEAHLTAEYDEPVAPDDLHRRFLPGAFAHKLKLSNVDGFPGDRIEQLVEADIDTDELDEDGLYKTTASLLETVCRVAEALERGPLQQLRRTSDFTISVTPDAREPGELGVARYSKFKKRRNAERRSSPALIVKPKPGI